MTDNITPLPHTIGAPIIVAEHVVKRFGKLVALDDVSLEVRTRRGADDYRPQRLGQVDAAALHQPPGGARQRADRRGRHRAEQAQGQYQQGARGDRDGLPALRAVPASDSAGEYHAGAASRSASAAREEAERIALDCSKRSASPRRPTTTRRSSPAGSSSASRSPAPWRCSPRSCSSTSRPRRSTRR